MEQFGRCGRNGGGGGGGGNTNRDNNIFLPPTNNSLFAADHQIAVSQQQQQQQQTLAPAPGVEDITNRLNQMNVDLEQQQQNLNAFLESRINQQQQQRDNKLNFNQDYPSDQMMMEDDDNEYSSSVITQQHTGMDTITHGQFFHQQQQQQRQQQQHHQPQQQNMSNIIIATNVDSAVFSDKLMQAKFEALFTPFDLDVTFRYLKSFRRVRLDFTSVQSAELARENLSHYKLGNTEFKCYSAQIIKANNNNSQNEDCNDEDQQSANNNSNIYLNIPKLTKQFLISPPASPPVGWEPVTENSPCIDVQLISAIANLVPGKVHEIHPASESQPGIFVEVCEDVQFGNIGGEQKRTCSTRMLPRTMSPATFSQQ